MSTLYESMGIKKRCELLAGNYFEDFVSTLSIQSNTQENIDEAMSTFLTRMKTLRWAKGAVEALLPE